MVATTTKKEKRKNKLSKRRGMPLHGKGTMKGSGQGSLEKPQLKKRVGLLLTRHALL